MRFFKPTWGKVVSAIIFTLFPYILAFLLVGWQHDTSGWGGAYFRLMVVLGTPPLWLIATLSPFSDDTSFFYIYPPFSFLAWYLISCILAIVIKKPAGRESKSKNRTPAK